MGENTAKDERGTNMKITKRILSVLLLMAMLVGMLPAGAMAEEVQTTVESDGVTVEGTNSFGSLLADEIQEETASSESGGYNVIGLTIEDGYAIVEYDTLEEAILVAALYTEDGLQLLTSGSMTVYPGETVAEIEIAGEIPEYFMASAYLLDTYDHSPLCSPYDTPMYTQEMQELLASTTEDYDADRVLNLDESTTTNFAVYTDNVQVITYAEGVNTVTGVDDENATYVIENADSSITALQTGDIFAYGYSDEDLLIVKVASITVDGTTATITGDDLELEEVFSHMKLETSGDAADIIVDESAADESVTYEGMVSEDEGNPVAYAVDGESSLERYLSFTWEKELKAESDYAEASVTIKGSIGISLDINFAYYVSFERQFIHFTTDVGLKTTASITGKAALKLPLGEFMFVFYGVGVGFKPVMELEFSGKAELELYAGMTVGMSYENKKGMKNLTTSPKVTSELKLEATVFFGLDLVPTIEVAKGALIEISLNSPIGLELKTEKTISLEDVPENPECIHPCQVCIAMVLSFKAEFSAKLKFLKCKRLTVESDLTVTKIKISDLYWSWDNDEFGWGTCPYKTYRVTIQLKDADGIGVPETEVFAGKQSLGTTNSNGALVVYLMEGLYSFTATVNGGTVRSLVTVDGSKKVTLRSASEVIASGTCGMEGDTLTWKLYDTGLLRIEGSGYMASYEQLMNGEFSAPWYEYAEEITSLQVGDNIKNIGGYAFCGCSKLAEIELSDSVEWIGDYAFRFCGFAEVTIPESVNTIGMYAFSFSEISSVLFTGNAPYIYSDAFLNYSGVIGYYPADDDTWTQIVENNEISSVTWIPYGNVVTSGICGDDLTWTLDEAGTLIIRGSGAMNDFAHSGAPWYSDKGAIKTVVIENGVTHIGQYAFLDCSAMTNITIPDSVTSIGDSVFYECSSLTDVTIPDGVTSLGSHAFFSCDNLKSVNIPDGVTDIGTQTFYYCTNLTNISIPSGVTSIEKYAFCGCSSLESITIPDGVTGIGEAAFSGCTGLTSITLPNSVVGVGKQAFYRCTGLTDLTLSDSMTGIAYQTFYKCTNLTSVVIPNNITSIGEGAFSYCTSLTNINIPDGVTTMGTSAFSNCTSLQSIFIPGSLSQIGVTAFNNCTALVSVIIEDGVTDIAGSAFQYCSSLESITIPDSVTSIGQSAFTYCTSLSDVVIGSGVAVIGNAAFSNCTNLTNINIPDGVYSIGSYAFSICTGLTDIVIPDSVLSIGDNAFNGCSNLDSILIPDSVTSIGWAAFSGCTSLTGITFERITPPSIGSGAFSNVTATVYYPESELWTEDVRQNYGGTLTWVSYTPGDDGVSTIAEAADDGIALLSVWDGEYETEVTDDYILKIATFTGLVPGEEYVLLNLVSLEVEDKLAADNLLYIAQDTADADGNLVFTYVQRVDTETSYVMACGASHDSVEDATITFPEMLSGEELQVVEPTVVFDGQTLVEGVDYIITGTVDYTAAGTYTCYIRGIYNYSGMVECSYTVTDAELTFKNTAINAQSYIGAQFIVNTSAAAKYDSVYIVAVNGENEIVLSENIGGSYYVYQMALAAKQMTDVYDVTIYGVKDDQTYKGATMSEWTLKKMIVEMLDKKNVDGNSETDQKQSKVLANLLNYGAEAQKAFSYNTDNLATDGLAEEHAALIETSVELANTGSVSENGLSGATLYKGAMDLQSIVTLQMIFKLPSNDPSAYRAEFVCNGETHTIQGSEFTSGGNYWVAIYDKLAARDVRTLVEVTVYDNATNEAISETYSQSIESIGYGMVQNGSKYTAVLNALMAYGDAANALFS